MYRDHIKRLLDLVLSLAAAVVLAIPMAALAVWIKLDSPGPVFFRQRRVGAHKVHFNILKFRTMRGDTPHDVPTHLLKNADSYITKSGAFLRRTSLDELPQIYNIIAGQMSIIGPRPALYNQYDLIEARDAVHANDIRPGLTGLAQINGRDELPIEVKARYDGEYAADVTFRRDVSIFFHSITYVFARRGVVEGGTGALDAEKTGRAAPLRPRWAVRRCHFDGKMARFPASKKQVCGPTNKNTQEKTDFFVENCCKSQAGCVKYTSRTCGIGSKSRLTAFVQDGRRLVNQHKAFRSKERATWRTGYSRMWSTR